MYKYTKYGIGNMLVYYLIVEKAHIKKPFIFLT